MGYLVFRVAIVVGFGIRVGVAGTIWGGRRRDLWFWNSYGGVTRFFFLLANSFLFVLLGMSGIIVVVLIRNTTGPHSWS